MSRAGFLTPAARKRLELAASQAGKAVMVGPVFDTIKRAEDGLVTETLDRDRLRQPFAWAYTIGNEPAGDQPPADWFVGAAIVE